MEIVEYDDVIAIRYTEISEHLVDARRKDFDLVFSGINGHEIKVTLVARQRKDGVLKVAEAHFDKDVSESDIADLSFLHWFILPIDFTGKKLPPILTYWEIDEYLVIACLPWGNTEWQPFAKQVAFLKDEKMTLDPDRALCWWPDMNVWNGMREIKNLKKIYPINNYSVNFFTYNEWYARPDMHDTSPKERAYEYARHIRRLRTMLLWCRKNDINVKLKLGNTEKSLDAMKKRGLDPLEETSWTLVSDCFDQMPDVYIEESKPCGPIGVVGSDIRASLGYVSHLPEMAPTLDCVTAALYSGSARIGNFVVWINPLAENAAEKAIDAIMNTIASRGVRQVAVIDGVLPFEACDCGAMSFRVPDEWITSKPVVQNSKIGRNDPCPCGSGRKYKKCCGRPKM